MTARKDNLLNRTNVVDVNAYEVVCGFLESPMPIAEGNQRKFKHIILRLKIGLLFYGEWNGGSYVFKRECSNGIPTSRYPLTLTALVLH